MMKRARGFSLIELMVTVSVLGIIAVLTLPSFGELANKRRVQGAAEELYGVMMHARSQALKKSRDIVVSNSGAGGTWAYGMTDKDTDGDGVVDACDPAKTAPSNADDSCTLDYDNDPTTADPYLVRKDSTDFTGVSLANTTGLVRFNSLRATANTHGTTFSAGGYELRVVVGLIGRAKICRPTGAPPIGGYNPC